MEQDVHQLVVGRSSMMQQHVDQFRKANQNVISAE
jgi:hypothetical protein